MDKLFEVILSSEVKKFLGAIEPGAKRKILKNIEKSCAMWDTELFKKLTDDIWEFRTLFNSIHYRLLAFWDKSEKGNTLVIATHGFIKKSSKVPKKEILKAISYRRIYFERN